MQRQRTDGVVADGDFIAIFNSIHRVMKAEKELKSLALPILLIPAPRAISSDCGLGIRYAASYRLEVEAALEKSGLAPAETYIRSGDAYSKV